VTSHLHLIESGQVEVIKDNKIITKLGSGKIINELALVNDLTCSSTIRAHTTVIIWTLHRKFLRNFLQKIENNFKCSQIEFLKTVTMFEKLNDLTLRQIADVLKIAKYECGERIIKQGEVGEKFYLLVQGQVSVTQSGHTSAASAFLSGGATSTPRELVQLGIGKYFGELALISNEPRKANVVALTSPVICYTLDKQSFTSILGTLHEAETESTGITILRKVKLLSGLSEKQLLIIAKCLETVRYVAGEEIIRQGEEGERFFMIVSGEVLVTVNHVEVARLKSGSYFGEMALMNNERRNATITAVMSESENITSEGGEEGRGDVVCLTLNRTEVRSLPSSSISSEHSPPPSSQFVRFLGPLDQILKEEAQRREEEASNRGLLGTAKRLTKSFAQSFLSPRSSVKKVTGIGVASSVEYDLDEFQHIRTLGYGRFGSVKLVKREGFNGVYALKILFKQPLLDLNLQQSPYQERDLLQLFDHPFIPAIYATFQDQHCFYLLLEAIPGGDFWTILYDRQSWTKIDTRSNLGGLTSLSVHALPSSSLYPTQVYILKSLNSISRMFCALWSICTITRWSIATSNLRTWSWIGQGI
jgi:CRP-like cAMP-binding protein